MSAHPAEDGGARLETTGTNARTELLEQLLLRAFEAIERGEPVDIAVLCSAHPELVDSVAAALGRAPELRRIHRDATRIDASIGSVLGDRYRLDERIGAGAMGVVYRAHDLELGRAVAIKVLRPELVVGARMDTRLAREGEVLASIRHPGVVTVYDRGQAEDGRAFLVMELLRGCSAAHLLRGADGHEGVRTSARERVARFQEVLGPEVRLVDSDVRQIVAWVASAAAGLHAAHLAGVVHRDVKPSNLFVERDGRLIVLDFGIVSSGSHATLGSDGSPLGTPAYMAPEQLVVDAEPDVRSDVYGLAATLYHLLTGRPPFEGTVPQVLATIGRREPMRAEKLRPGLPVDLIAIIEKGMASEPAQRYASAAALRDDLIAWLEYRPVSARRASWLASGWRRTKRSPQVRTAASLLLVMGIAAMWWDLSARHAAERLERWCTALAQVPPSLVDALPRYRASSSLRRSAAVTRVLDEMVELAAGPDISLALRAIHRSDAGDLDGAAADVERIVRGGDAPFAELAAARYRAGELPDRLAQGEAAPVTGCAADRVLAVVHAMRSEGPCPLWVEELLARNDGLVRQPGFHELQLLLQLRRVSAMPRGDENMAAFEQLDRSVRQLQTLRQRPSAIACKVQANALIGLTQAIEALEVARIGMALAPDEFTLPIAGGGAALARFEWETAAEMYQRAIDLQPESVHPHLMLGDALMGAGRFDEAEALLAQTPFESSALGEAQRAAQQGMLLFQRAWQATHAEQAGAEPAPEPNDAQSLARRAQHAFRRARLAFGGPRSLEEIVCDDLLGEPTACVEMFELLQQRPLDARVLSQVATILPESLGQAEIDALAQFLLRQAAQLGVRSR